MAYLEIWKEAEEKILRECGVDEAVIEQIRTDDRADFNSNRRFYRWTSDFGECLEGIADRENITNWKCPNNSFLNFGRWNGKNRNLQQWNQRHRKFNEVWDETLYRRALRVPKSLDERMMEKEQNEIFAKAVARLPKIQRRRFLLYYEYDFNFYQIGEMEHCTASAVQKSVSVAKEKVKAEMRKYLKP